MKKLILVTGAHRSGSTWVGRIISSANNVRYVHEPFNIAMKRDYTPFNHWFEHINDNTDPDQQKIVQEYLRSFVLPFHVKNIKNAYKIRSFRSGYNYLSDLKNRQTKRTLIKDPIAIMSAEWIYKNFDSDVVIIIRHPAAFVASLKVKDWTFDFNHFLDQKELMNDNLSNYKNVIEDYANNEYNIIHQGILLWNSIYTTVLKYKELYKNNWYFVKHEDISLDPMNEYEKIFDFLNIKMDKKVKDLIIGTTTSRESTNTKRDAKANIKSWKNRLSTKEIDLIKEQTYQVWSKFYNETDWK